MKNYIFIALGFFLFASKTLLAQDNFGVVVPFLTYHLQKDEQAYLQPNRLDKDAKFVLNYGLIAHYERFIYQNRLSVKVVQAAYSDCATLFAGFTHIALRYKFISTSKHELRAGFGPTYIYRQSWYRFPGYIPTNKYLKEHGDWQSAFSLLGGEIEYDYKLNDKVSINVSVIPAIPDLLFFSLGFRYWIRPIPQNSFWKTQAGKRKLFYRSRDLN